MIFASTLLEYHNQRS